MKKIYVLVCIIGMSIVPCLSARQNIFFKKKKKVIEKKYDLPQISTNKKIRSIVQQKAAALYLLYKQDKGLRQRSFNKILKHVDKEIDQIAKAYNLENKVSDVSVRGSHYVLHVDEGSIVQVKKHGNKHNSLVNPQEMNALIQKVISLFLLKKLDKIYPEK